MSQYEFSIIIVGYKNLQVVIDCLESIEKYNDIGEMLEIIIVDNSPDDNIFNYVSTNWGKVNIIKNDNKGFGEGNNVGAKVAKGKYLLLLNPDTLLIEPIFQFAVEKFENEKNLALFGVKLVNKNLKRNMSYYLMDRNGFLAAQINKICNKFDIFFDGKMFISGANIFIKKDIFISSGMFDENIFMYREESDLIKRIKKLNLKTAFFKSKRIVHLEGETTGNNKVSLRRRLESSKYYCSKYDLNFNNQLNQEIKYNNFKMIVYKLLLSENQHSCKSNINILKEFSKNNG